MKSAIPWILVLALLGGVYFLYSANNEKSVQLAKMDAQTTELENLRKDNEELKKLPAQNEELARLRKDNLELLRLRGEVQQLHTQMKQLTNQLVQAQSHGTAAEQKLSRENEALREQAEKLQLAQAQASKTPGQEQFAACVNNIRIIEAAKQQWALQNSKPADAVPSEADITPFLPPNTQITCPSGGTYTINAVGVAATCSIPGHTLAK